MRDKRVVVALAHPTQRSGVDTVTTVAESEPQGRPWDRFLTDRDREHLAGRQPPYSPKRVFGDRPALILIDNWTSVLGEEPLPLLESVKRWPMSTGTEGWSATSRTVELLRLCRSRGVLVVHTTISTGTFSPGPWLSWIHEGMSEHSFDFVPALAPRPGEVVIERSAPSGFWGTSLIAVLHQHQIDTLIFCGESTSGCVRATVVDAASHRFRSVVVEDCVYDRHEASHAINLFDMDQKYARVVPATAIEEWLERLPATAKQG